MLTLLRLDLNYESFVASIGAAGIAFFTPGTAASIASNASADFRSFSWICFVISVLMKIY